MTARQHRVATSSFFFLLVTLVFLLSVSGGVSTGEAEGRQLFNLKPSKLLVFGDSYVDTGNIRKAISRSWKFPYGLTFPGKPTGRFSDGRVLTDYLARFIGVKSPIPYKWRKIGYKSVRYGMNFAYGGTGVFDTLAPLPNMTTQIDFLQQIVSENTYSASDLHSSVALVSVAGNDYSSYLARNGSLQDLPAFISQVVNQTSKNLIRLHGAGVKKVMVTGLPPLGCLPATTASNSFQQCDQSLNQLVTLHNLLLTQSVAALNNATGGPTFVMLDMYGAFMAALPNGNNNNNKSALKPCCVGTSASDSCGSVDEDGGGMKRYTVCQDPEAAFFWDGVHPTQAGWRAVYSALKSNLMQL
ncbi:unnamed protein product [Linum tenue]|uniref:GDSL esterase/lipase n=1 Tax=Linum tenue TaxID=586396 RepID=A0AAV0JEP8_9ROSI|nr:unnamed protein product [Linum tenue]